MDKSLSASDQKLYLLYLQTVYLVPEVTIQIIAEQLNPSLDKWLEANKSSSWSFITAWNPLAKVHDADFNHRKQDELRQELDQANYHYLPAVGRSPDGRWSEDSLLVLDISRAAAIDLGRAFRQKAILYGRIGEEAELFFC